MVMAAAPCVSPEASPARPGTLTRKLAAMAGAALMARTWMDTVAKA